MGKANMSTRMEAITLAIGWRERCRVLDNCTIPTKTYNMRESGRMTTMMGRVSWLATVPIGLNMRESSSVGRCKDSVRCSSKTGAGTKENSEGICLGARGECSWALVRYKQAFGSAATSFLLSDPVIFTQLWNLTLQTSSTSLTISSAPASPRHARIWLLTESIRVSIG